MFELFVSEYPFELLMFSQLLLVVPNTSAIVSRVWSSFTLVAALSTALNNVSAQETDAPVRAASAELFPSNAPSMESSRLTDCSKFNMSVVCSLTVFVRFERFDVFCSTTLIRAVALLSNVALDERSVSTLLTRIELASRSVRRLLTSALFDARSAAIATVFA